MLDSSRGPKKFENIEKICGSSQSNVQSPTTRFLKFYGAWPDTEKKRVTGHHQKGCQWNEDESQNDSVIQKAEMCQKGLSVSLYESKSV